MYQCNYDFIKVIIIINLIVVYKNKFNKKISQFLKKKLKLFNFIYYIDETK